MAGTVEYQDRWISCTEDGLQVKGYYFPWGTKHIPYRSIRSLSRVSMGFLSGQSRIWGTANPRYWASLDPKRPSKRVALVLDVGAFVHPFLTPDDPDRVESVIRSHVELGPDDADAGPGFI